MEPPKEGCWGASRATHESQQHQRQQPQAKTPQHRTVDVVWGVWVDTSINNMEGSQTKKVNEGEEKGMESAKEREAETYADSPDELAN